MRLPHKSTGLQPHEVLFGFPMPMPFDWESRMQELDGCAPNRPLFPEEKTLSEAATAAFLCQRTQIPIPKLFKYGMDTDIGPFLVIQDLGSRRDICDILAAPNTKVRCCGVCSKPGHNARTCQEAVEASDSAASDVIIVGS